MEEQPTHSRKTDSFELVLVQLWLKDFDAESDRAAVILGASKLEQLLRELLVKKFLPNPTGQDELFDSDKPISTFSARINVAHRLGLIDKHFANSLHLIRRIRNEFAHEAVGASLDGGAHRDRVKTLVGAFSRNKYFEEYCSKFSAHSEISKRFRAFVSVLSLRLEGAIECTNAVEDEHAWDIMPLIWVDEK